jgi:cytochrome c556
MTKRILGGLIAVAFLAFPAGVATGQQSKANRPATKASEKNGKDVEANVSEGDDISKDQSENEKSPEMDKSSGVVRPASFWMEQKLRLSSNILESLAHGDFEQMTANAELMLGLNKIESFWRRGEAASEYRAHLGQFALANRRLIRSARKENIEGAALAFNQLTVSCVSCHQHLRADGSDKP